MSKKPQTKSVQLKFFGKDEILKVVDTRGSIVKYLTKESTLCPLIGSEIELTEIGRGKGGTVFSIKFPGMGKKRYVVKVVQDIPLDRCLTKSDRTIPKTNENGFVNIPYNSYVCYDERYSEYVLSVLVGELYRKGECINFIDTFDFATCHTPIDRQYIFMEQIDTDLLKINTCIFDEKNPEHGTSAMIQILFAIASYQQYKIVHGDIHQGNVFIEYVSPDTIFDGQRLMDADYFYYEIGGIVVYIPFTPFIMKIGDWGLACKYSSPMVLNKTSVHDGYDQYDGAGPWLPNFFSHSYDEILIFSHNMIQSNAAQSNDDLQRMFAEMIGMKDKINVLSYYSTIQMNKGNSRPKPFLWDDKKILSPYQLLTEGTSTAKFRQKPSGKGIRIGTLKEYDE